MSIQSDAPVAIIQLFKHCVLSSLGSHYAWRMMFQDVGCAKLFLVLKTTQWRQNYYYYYY